MSLSKKKINTKHPISIRGLAVVMVILMTLMLMASCKSDDDAGGSQKTRFSEYTVAVVLPESETVAQRWRNTIQWAIDNIEEAQCTQDSGVRLKVEYHQESRQSMAALSKTLANRQDIVAVIGPNTAERLDTMAGQCYKTLMPLFAPTVSSEQVIRRYSTSSKDKCFLWSLTETDITQCEILLYKAQAAGAKKVSLLAPDNLYGKTFYDWFAFQATELGLTPQLSAAYKSEERDSCIMQMAESDVDCVICAASTIGDVKAVLEGWNAVAASGRLTPNLLFSDAAMSPDLLNMGDAAQGAEGLAMYADPSTGFTIAYQEHFNQFPTAAEVRVYDALMLTAFAVAYCKADGEVNHVKMNAAIRMLTNMDGTSALVWNGMGMQYEFEAIARKAGYYHILGGSGEITFDQKVYTSVLKTTYCHWYVYDGKFILIDYSSTDGSNHVSSTMASWYWNKTYEEIFEDSYSGSSYGTLNAQWAVLIAASEDWVNYRHQADVLNVYQILRNNGFDDDHIILIMRDDIAYDLENVYPGVVKVSDDGENLYQNVKLDYCIDSLCPADFSNILTGQRSAHLPTVLNSGADDNVLVFWSGHGVTGRFCWLSNREKFRHSGFTADMFRTTLQQMHDQGRYRKMLWLVETCHTASVTKEAVGIPGVLTIAASRAEESSSTTAWSEILQTYLSNTFTQSLTETIRREPAITFRNLYYLLNRNTINSHVQIDNAANFDNLYRSSINEFIMKK